MEVVGGSGWGSRILWRRDLGGLDPQPDPHFENADKEGGPPWKPALSGHQRKES